MKMWILGPAVLLCVISVSGCSGAPDLPDRASPAVRAEEARLATVLGADSSIVDGQGVCKVRLLGEEAGASFVWALCRAVPPGTTAVSAPFRVDGSKVTVPKDGAGFSPSVREMFPGDLAEFVLDNQGSSAVLP